MHPRLHRLSLVSATLLLSLASPLQLTGTPLRINAASVQAQTSQNRNTEALRLFQVGVQQLDKGEFREALQVFEQVLGMVREIGERQGEGLTLAHIGVVYDNLRHYADALKYYQQALVIRQQVGDKAGEGTTLHNIGKVYNKLGQYADALKYYQPALVIRQQIGDKAGEGDTLNNIGLVYDNLGQYADALKSYQQALLIAKQIGDKAAEGITLNNIGRVYGNLGQYADALKYYQQALVIGQQVSDKAGEGTTLNNIGTVYDGLGQYAQALKYYQQALVIGQQVGDKAGEKTTLHNIGAAYSELGQYAQALKFYEQALVIVKQIGDKAGEGTTLNNIGTVHNKQGQYADALKYHQQALVIRQKVADKAGEGASFNNIGVVYDNLGQYADALKYYQQALVIAKQIGNKSGEGSTLNNIGAVYSKWGQYADALKSYQQALVIAKQIGDKAGEATALNNSGRVYQDLGQYADALKAYQPALVIAKQLGSKATEGITLNNIGGVYDNLGQYADALKAYQQALVLAKEISNKASVGITLNNIGGVYKTLGQYPDAEKSLFAAIEVLESLRPGLTDANKVSIFETQAFIYRSLQQVLVAQNKTNSALEIAERGRARAFVELLAEKFSDNVGAQGLAPLKPPINPPKIQEIQQIAKEQNATLIEYSIVDDAFINHGKVEWRKSELYIWVVKPTGEVAFKTVDLKSLKTPLKDLVTSSRDSIGVRGRPVIGVVPRPGFEQRQEANQTENLQQLHKLLIEPIAQFLPTNPSDRVIFIPQNQLFLVPFPALKDASGKYLIEKHTILTAPAIQVLQLTREKRQSMGNRERRVGSGDVLVVGNPTMPTNLTAPTGELIKLSPLPSAEQEALAIANLLKTKALTGDRATKAVVEQQMTKARIIHLATHGLLNDFKGFGVPGAIALAPSSNNNGLLTSSEILDMKFNAELVVLSACDTGRGDITGDGVIGLSRSLITAGVPSVIVSLWAVPDAPTASLMTQFYQNLQQNPDKAQALRNAMLTTMKQHPNPKNWAAFTLIGESE
jgi:CHAT domain-containing protein/Tfp pilus assembly protein PilF